MKFFSSLGGKIHLLYMLLADTDKKTTFSMKGYWLKSNDLKVIPNIRFGDHQTFDCCCDGASRHGVICIGTLGCIKDKHYRTIFENGLEYVVNKLKPEILLLYGSNPSNIEKLKKTSAKVIIFKPDYSFFKKEKEKMRKDC